MPWFTSAGVVEVGVEALGQEPLHLLHIPPHHRLQELPQRPLQAPAPLPTGAQHIPSCDRL